MSVWLRCDGCGKLTPASDYPNEYPAELHACSDVCANAVSERRRCGCHCPAFVPDDTGACTERRECEEER